MQQPPWMAHAWAGLGQHEIPGAAANPRITRYFRRAGHPTINNDETAWCAAFVGACLEDAGIKGTRSLRARSYLEWGASADVPTFGAITVLPRGDDRAQGHVGFLVGTTETHIYLLGGNQSDAVSVMAFDRSTVLDYRLPSPAQISSADTQDTPTATITQGPPGFDAALARILHFEGGWTDDPFDPGGPTNRGITLSTFAHERGIDVTAETVTELKAALRRISDADLRCIYLERYWKPARCSEMPPALALIHFDASVNQGVTGAARMLQDALHVAIDGEIGPITLAAANSCELADVIARYAAIRRAHYRSLSHFWRFGRGWLRRVDAVERAALGLASGRSAPTSASIPSTPQKGNTSMSSSSNATTNQPSTSTADQPQPGKWWGESLTIWGALLTAVTTVAPAVFAAFGIDMPVELLRTFSRDVTAVFQAVGGLVGTVLTIFGRIRAKQPIERRIVQVRL